MQEVNHQEVIEEYAVADVPEKLVNPVKFECCQPVHRRDAQGNAGGHFGVGRPTFDPAHHDRCKDQCRCHSGTASNRETLRLRFVEVAAAQEDEQDTRQQTVAVVVGVDESKAGGDEDRNRQGEGRAP
ncbi:hypothetical protein D9M71_754920 [compost metagenome]